MCRLLYTAAGKQIQIIENGGLGMDFLGMIFLGMNFLGRVGGFLWVMDCGKG